MELTDECLETIKAAARKIDHGDLHIKIMARLENQQSYDVVFGTEERIRFRKAIPTEDEPRSSPPDRY
ncbi:MAG: hypothetical protein LBK43_01365 [Treponema sp.]|jgi:hypothetical protein|nr:hypothetical protein [Treponema sp.]